MAIGMKLYRDQDLTRGIAVDAPLDASQQGPRPRVRQPIMLTQTARKTEAGRYMLELYAKRRPTRAFWVEAVSSERKVVLAQQWVVPDAAGRIRMPVGLRSGTGQGNACRRPLLSCGAVQACAAVARCGCSALVARCGMYHAYMPVLSVPSTLVLPIARDVFCRPLQDHEISVALKRLDNMIGRC
ncbi:hypothetical protein XGA_1008 [Xanthomonas hortorum ATCC 19865]|nr:hypothetical protein XGA_1008 [Xanthomonas hortorum ATCC 19865]